MTVCPACRMDSALIVDDWKYVCAACGGTGTVEGDPTKNVPDEVPDAEARAHLRALWEERASMKEFVKVAKAALKRRPKLVE